MQMNNNMPNMMNNNNNNFQNMMFNNNNMNNNVIQNNIINKISKIEITFKTTDEKKFTINVDCEMTIGDLLKQYCKEFGHPEFIGTYNKIKFIFKSELLRFEDKTPLILKFMSRESQKIIVHNVSDLIG